MEEHIGPGWAGFVTRDVIEPLAQAIEQQFGGKLFSTMYLDRNPGSPFPQSDEAIPDRHRRLDEIGPRPDSSDPYIWIIARTSWSIHTGSFVCLSNRGLFVERMYIDGHEIWCWMLEE